MARREVDPLASIPSPRVVRDRLQQIQREARRLEYLLTVAEQTERLRQSDDVTVTAAESDGAA